MRFKDCEFFDADCDICGHEWEQNLTPEKAMPDSVECPKCGHVAITRFTPDGDGWQYGDNGGPMSPA